ncbi:MAG: 4-(cytidine 5'-diphospho)-2-C-methyl-D-erythritol kinase, partial [Clostridiales bacterium]|nr:4-(cytidine 5'-diphospho)-2-C-methyl-D-erythritol kinase [Clostridiales bacterium]
MNTVRLNAYAKINLTLELTGTQDGYHLLDSLVTSIDLYDRIVVKRRKDTLIRVFMHGLGSETISPEENNAQRAGEAFVKAFQTTGADITVYKNIPIGAGLGGSSADAAGVINALAKLYKIDDFAALKSLADSLGSDTGYLLTGGFARMTGRGERVEHLGEIPSLPVLLILPKEGVSTAECYRLSDTVENADRADTKKSLELMKRGELRAFCASLKNDLYPAAKQI